MRGYYKKDVMELYLNQSHSYNNGVRTEDFGKVEDDIIAITVRIIIEVQYKLYGHPRTITPNRGMMVPNTSTISQYDEEKIPFINQLYRSLTQNPRSIRMQKTLCSLIITAI